MRWTVLLPTFNRPDTLALSIASVLTQQDGDLELLVVGDGCTDDTSTVVASFGDPRIRWFDLPKAPGFGYANRRLALESATGRYLALASHDDLWSPRHLATLGPLLDDGADFAYSLPTWALPTGAIVPLPFDLRDPVMRERFELSNAIPAPFVVAALSAVERAGGWPADVEAAADWHLMLRILAQPGARVDYAALTTALHFRSVRRTEDHFIVDAITRVPGLERSWPPAARLEPRPGETQQAAAAAGIEADPGAWWRELEKATTTVLSALALAALDLVEQRAIALDQIAMLERARIEVDEAYRSSTSWRATAWLRALTSAVRRSRG